MSEQEKKEKAYLIARKILELKVFQLTLPELEKLVLEILEKK